MRRWWRPSPATVLAWVAIAALCAWLLLASVPIQGAFNPAPTWTDPWLSTVVVLIAASLTVMTVRPAAGTAALYGLALADAALAAGWHTPYSTVPFLIAVVGLYAVWRSPTRRRWPWLAATGVLIGHNSLSNWPDWRFALTVFALQGVILFGVAAILAEVTRRRFLLVDMLRQRAVDLDRLSALEAAAAAAGERARLARTTHDVLADAVMAMIIQAGAGSRMLPTRRDAAHEAFAAVESAGRRALDELRRAVQAARADDPVESGQSEQSEVPTTGSPAGPPGAAGSSPATALSRLQRLDLVPVIAWTVVIAAVIYLAAELGSATSTGGLSWTWGSLLVTGIVTVVPLLLVAMIALRPVPATVALYVMTVGVEVLMWTLFPEMSWSIAPLTGSMIGLYVVLRKPTRRRWPWLAATALLIINAISWRPYDPYLTSGVVLSSIAGFGLAAITAEVARRRLRMVAVLLERTHHLQRSRVLQSQTAVAAERMRVAREMHDVIAHTVMAMVVQAGAGRRAVDRRPDDAQAAFAAIQSVGRQARDELRHVMGIVRVMDRPGVTAATVVDVASLVAQSPVPVQVRVTGEPVVLDPALDLTAYRIVQEALTNVGKHAPNADAVVELTWRERSLEVQVSDAGSTRLPHTPPGGFGLQGMAERVAQCDGSVTAGPRTDGSGWTVRAVLPLDRHSLAA